MRVLRLTALVALLLAVIVLVGWVVYPPPAPIVRLAPLLPFAAVSLLVLLAILTWWVTGTLRRLDADRVRSIQREREARIAEGAARHEIEALLESTLVGIYGLDLDGRCTLINSSAAKLLGYAPDELIGRQTHAAFHHTRPDGSTYPFEDCPVFHALRRETTQRVDSELLWRRDGTSFIADFSISSVMEDAHVVGAVATFVDVSDRKRVEDERRIAYEAAERSRRELAEIMASREGLIRGFSHDLRNPLGAADGHLQALELGLQDGLSENQASSIRRVRRSIAEAMRMVEDLTELAKAESGDIELEKLPIDLCRVAREVVDNHRASAEGKDLKIDATLPQLFPRVESDPSRIRQILGNLLSNAIKYTDRGGIELVVEVLENGSKPGPPDLHHARWVAVRVKDTGIGIPKGEEDLVFREFTRLRSGREDGAGIGLAISRRLARALGGDITVTSEAGEGSLFTLWLPMRGNYGVHSCGSHPPN